MREGIIFAKIKGETLFIATRHISFCAEINHFRANDLLCAIESILDSAKSLPDSAKSLPDSAKSTRDSAESLPDSAKSIPDSAPKNTALSQNLDILRQIKRIRAYTPTHILNHLEDEKVVVIYYKETATGDFQVDENSPFKEIFEDIKSAIKRNLANELKRKN